MLRISDSYPIFEIKIKLTNTTKCNYDYIGAPVTSTCLVCLRSNFEHRHTGDAGVYDAHSTHALRGPYAPYAIKQFEQFVSNRNILRHTTLDQWFEHLWLCLTISATIATRKLIFTGVYRSTS